MTMRMPASSTFLKGLSIPSKSNLLFSSHNFCETFNNNNKNNNVLPSHYHDSHYSLLKISPRFHLSSSSSKNTRPPLASIGDAGKKMQEEEEEEARAAVAEILQEEGVSEEESVRIVSNSPNYARMLIEGVRELDEASLWDSWKVGRVGSGGGVLSFREKVLHMAKEKRDRGILPFLESIGLNPSTSTHVARYLSSETLLNLIHKVCLRIIIVMILPRFDSLFCEKYSF